VTVQMRRKLGPLQDSCKGKCVWILGSGPTLDDCDISRMSGDYIFALNSSYTFVWDHKMFNDAWWLLFDLRAYSELKERVKKIPLVKALVCKKSLEQMRELRNGGQYVEFVKLRFEPERSIVETALLIADFLGFDEAYMVGVDGFVPRDGVPYCKAIDEWKKCHFMDKTLPDSWKGSSRDIVKALKAVKERLSRLEVFQTSTAFPEPIFQQISFEEALKRSEAFDAAVTRGKGKSL